MRSALLAPLLQEWHQLLGQWARTGELAQAAQDALGLQAQPEPLQRWLGAWGAGMLADLPPVELVPAAALPAALGAYAPATGIIYLNAEWLQGASRQEALAVLTEELGHHLDAQLNSADTPGDEGEPLPRCCSQAGLSARSGARPWPARTTGAQCCWRARS